MKKLISAILLICICLSLVSCGPNDDPGTAYEITTDMIERDCESIAPLIAEHSMQFVSAYISAQSYDKNTNSVKGTVTIYAETPVYDWQAECDVVYSAVGGELTLSRGSVADHDYTLKDGEYPGDSYIRNELNDRCSIDLQEIGDVSPIDAHSVSVEFTGTQKDGKKTITRSGILSYTYDFENETWVFIGLEENEPVETASYDDKTGIYDVLLTNEIVETPDGLVIKAYKVKTVTFDDAFIENMRPGDVIKLNKYLSPWGGRQKDITISYIEENTVNGRDTIFIAGSYDGDEVTYFQYDESIGKWVLFHEYMGDSPTNGAIQYISSEMYLLIADTSKVTKMAYFDMTFDENMKDIRKLFTSNGNVNSLRCQLRAYHGVVDWCKVHWGVNI